MAPKKTFQQPDRKAGDACTHVASRTSLKHIHALCHKRSWQHCAPVSAEGISGCYATVTPTAGHLAPLVPPGP